VDEREIMFRVPAEKIAVRSFPCRSDQFWGPRSFLFKGTKHPPIKVRSS
jgi:hypothetical protein